MSGQVGSDAFRQIFDGRDSGVVAVGAALDRRVLAAHPQSTIVAYPGYDAVSYGFGARKNSDAYLYLMPQKGRCNLGFYRGSALADPEGLLEGSGKDLRHAKVRDIATANGAAVGDLIHAAIDERREALGGN
ncbi:hypothetical protein DEA8626_03226 [Defluviimonas aquaemixtae]|uniref:YdhG-like domain-containing protein n=1 Tax=Albidovulum aquaemixtae TaxID=1542388 RepID=A0A2R8BL75_9RHOB|nr:DUF1801 domain-containing protein [Defluviimonas aquaemixtae]SPH24177.1 hypothetical protein DEA8626_03226 [Defluviimonas aquaemixtae]